MENIYLEFYKRQTRKIHKAEFEGIDLSKYPFLILDDEWVMLDHDILIGRLDRKKHFGFLRQDPTDIYIDQNDMKDAMHNDIVLVKEHVDSKVVYVVERALKVLIATVKKSKKGLFFEPEDYIEKRLFVEPYPGLVEGHVVLLEVESIDKVGVYTFVSKVVGHVNDPDIETLKIVHAYEWPDHFTDEVMDDLDKVDIDLEKEKKARLDLSKDLTITIDGSDAKDLDDAISLKVENGLYKVGVHIADVSHYVKAGSFLDLEAYNRSTSVYLADRVIPMLPHLLSNDKCSLNPHETKLTLSCLMTIDNQGKVVDYRIEKSFIESNRRMTYNEVNAFLNKGQSLGDPQIENMLSHMQDLSLILKKMRRQRGELEFESSELGFIVDKNGRVLDVYERQTDDAEQLIESFMLVANETVAFHMHHADLPSIYRVHEKPDVVKLKNALETIAHLGFKVNMKQVGKPEPLQILTKQTADTKYGYVVHMLLLRAMQKAKYAHLKDIHYGLGATYYTHFTSPIRRYPDLILHRMIHLFVLGEAKDLEKQIYHYESLMPDIAKHTSDQERKAVQMERDVAKLKSCEFMADKVGQNFKASITQMMPSGMFVKLVNGIEGFVPLRLLDDYYMYNEAQLTYIGSRGMKYKLGDQITVKLVSVDLNEKKMDYNIINTKKQNFKKTKHKHRRR